MPKVHRIGDARTCGAKTVQAGNSDVYANDKLIAVEDDPNDHGGGGLIASGAPTVSIYDKKIIVMNDHAKPDSAGHNDPAAADGSGDVSAGS